MSSPDFEDKYLDVLQNIEMSIVTIYRHYPELTDYNVDSALEALTKTYRSEERGKHPKPPGNHLALQVYESVKGVCEFRLGREKLYDKDDQPLDFEVEPATVSEIIACLKRIRKSVRLWNRQGGRQGYLNYVREFLK